MEKLNKRYIIKIPSSLCVFYCDKKDILLVKGVSGYRILHLKTKIIISNTEKLIKVTNKSVRQISINAQKKMKSIQGTTVALIRKTFFEISNQICKKLKLIGVGYRVFLIEILNIKLIHLKLGYSHSIYFKIPNSVTIKSHKSIKLFISGNSYNFVSQIAATIRKFKLPEPYKGKGILYENEKIVLKEGKKV